MDDQVAGRPIGAFVGVAFEDEAVAFGHAGFDDEGVREDFAEDFVAVAGGAGVQDLVAGAAALVAGGLDLLEDAGGEHVFGEFDAAAGAGGTGLGGAVFAAGAVAFVAERLLLDAEFAGGAGVEVAQGDGDADFLVGAAALAAVLEVAPAAGAGEELAEEVEGVVVLAGGAAALAVLLDAVVPVLVVDAAGLGCGEDVVGVGDFDEFLGGGVVVSVERGWSVRVWVEGGRYVGKGEGVEAFFWACKTKP